ncbi:DUF6951 family protein [Desulfotomaculum copahuensis]|uniref:Uncharacterized protein n=1 Tax=Desulfotomaculum copahuensis TaxID=1838280 RepID=A0A1B7LJN7_9FIRM|nr:hypothetical protein [Desulfotomaculum copahuensis]OAT86766.1 hypothetical protein A6M21_02320 [Desulfotomaculum copahuensis]
MVKGIIKSGVCGFTINAEAECQDGRHVQIKIASDCPNYRKIAAELSEVDAYQELFQKLHLGTVYQTFAKYSPHPGCPGPSGLLKVIEVAAGLALPQKASIEIWKEDA